MALSQEELKSKLKALNWVFSENAYDSGNEKKLSIRDMANIHLSKIDHFSGTPASKKKLVLPARSKTTKNKKKKKANVVKSAKLSSKTKSTSKKVGKKQLRKGKKSTPKVLSNRSSKIKKKPFKSVLKAAFKNKTAVAAGDGVRLLGGIAATRLVTPKIKVLQMTADASIQQPVVSLSKNKLIVKKESKSSGTNARSKVTKKMTKKKKHSPKKSFANVTSRVDSGLRHKKSQSATKKLKTNNPITRTRTKHSSRMLFKNVLKPSGYTGNDAAASAYDLFHPNM